MPATNFLDMLDERVTQTPSATALRSKVNGQWRGLTWQQVQDETTTLAHSLLALGVKNDDRVCIIAPSREEWVLADFATLKAGGATVPIYHSSLADQCAYIINDSASKICIVEDDLQLKKLNKEKANLSTVTKVVLMKGKADGDWAITWDEFRELGRKHQEAHPRALEGIRAGIAKDSIATIVYTSGTTGNPKGVVLVHECFTVMCTSVAKALPIDASDEQLLFLPLAHIFAKILMFSAVKIGFTTAFAESIDAQILLQNMKEVRPTVMGSVPRIYEKVHQKIVAGANQAGGLKQKIFNWSLATGVQVSQARQRGEEPSGLLAWKYDLAHKLVFHKIHELFGGRLKFFISGGAPLAREIAEFFHAAGILILEGYGLTETTAVLSVNRPDKFKFGTVGQVVPGVEVKIAQDGEILSRGPTMLREYYRQEDASAEALAEGWFHTGDIGEFDAEGFLRITDRKKDLIKTAGGKYVAPQNIENQLKQSQWISQVMVYGDTKPYCVALITLDQPTVSAWAAQNGLGADWAGIVKSQQVKDMIKAEVDTVNKKLASFESVKRFHILADDFSIEAGDLTPTLKVKRKFVTNKYKAEIDAMYAGGRD